MRFSDTQIQRKIWILNHPPGTLLFRWAWHASSSKDVCALIIGWHHPQNKHIEDDVDVNEFSAIIFTAERIVFVRYDDIGIFFQTGENQ